MKEQPAYVWVTEIFTHTDIPLFDRYVFLRTTKNGVKVRQYQGERLVRKSLERKFFYNESDMMKFFTRFITARKEFHERRSEELANAKTPLVRNVPDQAIFLKSTDLDS